MYKLLEYLKYVGIFWLFVFIIALITSLINIIGLNSEFIRKLSIIITAISFFVVAMLASNKNQDKGYIIGLKLGLLFIISLVIINLIIFKSSFNIERIIYYIILLASGILGGSFGKNFKIKIR